MKGVLHPDCPSCRCRKGTLGLDAEGVVGTDQPEQSKQAARTVRAGTQAHRIMAFLEPADEGMNAVELSEPMGLAVQVVCTRLSQMRSKGLVRYLRDDDGQIVMRQGSRPETRSAVVTLTLWGRRELRRHRE